MQVERRTEPHSWAWELISGGLVAVVLLIATAVHVGRGLAYVLVGGGWVWPGSGSTTTAVSGEFWRSLPAVIGGDALAGLATTPGQRPSPTLVMVTIAAMQLVVLGVSVAVVCGSLRRWGPGRLRGVASPVEAEQVLGVSRLRRVRDVLRPDRRGQRWSRDERPGVGWRLGRAQEPRANNLWVPWDRTTGVIGPQGSGKTLDLLIPALIGAPGAALVTMTKVEDLLLSLSERASDERPCVVLDPFGLAKGIPPELLGELVWDPVDGCVDSEVAQRRAKAFTMGTISSGSRGHGDEAARFYAAEAAKVLQSYLHAAALTGRTIDDVLTWVANPSGASDPEEILRRHPSAEPMWFGLLHAALHGDERTTANTVTTVQQALSLFFQGSVRRQCVPGEGRPATDIADLIKRRGTIYLLGREDPYASASPLMTAVAECVLDTALALANRSPWGGRLCPPFLACLDELPSTAPLPTLRTRMANERALGLSFIYAAQTRAQLTAIFGEQEARTLLGLTNILVVFGGSKDVAFNQELSDLMGTTRIARRTRQTGLRGGGSITGEDIAILKPEEIRQLPERQALVLAENAKPIIAKLDRCLDGKTGQRRLHRQQDHRKRLVANRSRTDDMGVRRAVALQQARALALAFPDHQRAEDV